MGKLLHTRELVGAVVLVALAGCAEAQNAGTNPSAPSR